MRPGDGDGLGDNEPGDGSRFHAADHQDQIPVSEEIEAASDHVGQDYGGNYGGTHTGYDGTGDDIDPSLDYGYPIILDLNDNGIGITELSNSTVFMDASGDGLKNRTAWAAAGDGVLFYDPDGHGTIVEKRQYVFTEWDPTAKSDIDALRSVFDSNGDGVFNASDDEWAGRRRQRTRPQRHRRVEGRSAPLPGMRNSRDLTQPLTSYFKRAFREERLLPQNLQPPNKSRQLRSRQVRSMPAECLINVQLATFVRFSVPAFIHRNLAIPTMPRQDQSISVMKCHCN